MFPFNKTNCKPRIHAVANPYPSSDVQAPDEFTVAFETTAGLEPVILEVRRDWAPLGVDRFYALVNDHYYDCAAFFRVVPDFVVQFGIAGQPEESLKWNTTIPDDPVVMSNLRGYVSYATAGPDTRTTQIFVNLVDNSRLDSDGFAPFAKVVQGMDLFQTPPIDNPTPNSTDGVDQDTYMAEGNEWILEEYPDIDLLLYTEVAPSLETNNGSSSTSGTTSSKDHAKDQNRKLLRGSAGKEDLTIEA